MSEILMEEYELNWIVRNANRMGQDGVTVNGVTVIPPPSAANEGINVAWDIQHLPITATDKF